MRKDVKIGLAIGGIVLAVLIVYVLKTPGEQKNEADNTPAKVAQTEPDIALGPSTTQPSPVAMGGSPSTQPSNYSDPFAARPTTNPVADTTTTPNGTGSNKTDWNAVLATGKSLSLSAAAPSRTSDEVAMVAMRGGSNDNGTSMLPLNEPSTRPSTGSRTHTVQKGETLSSIAQAAYGNANYYSLIARANPKINPAKLRPGTVITLPEASTSRDRQAMASSPTPASASLDSKHYKVQPGDSLEKISARLYGSTSKWEKIYELNKSKIGSDPHKIKAEMVLALPDEPATH